MVIDKVKDLLSDEPAPYQCNNCDTVFESTKDVGIARCPDCGGSDLMPAPE